MGYRTRDFTGDIMAGLSGIGQIGTALNDKKKADLLAKEGALRMKESEQQQKLNQQKIDANTAASSQASAAQKLMGDTESRGAMTPSALEGEKTSTGNAVNMDEIKSAKQADSDAKLYNMVNQGKEGFAPLSGRALRKMSEAKALDANKADQAEVVKEERGAVEFGEKKLKAGREAAESASSLKTAEAQRGLIGAQTLKAKADTGAKPAAGEFKLNEAQSKTVGAAGMAKVMLDEIANKFKNGGLGGAAGFAADVAESVPFVGGKMAPKTAEYNDQRRIVAETFLREATGAAAPAQEVKFYQNLLPEPGDNEQQAQSALVAFRGAVKAKVKGVAQTLRSQGREADAVSIEKNLESLFSDAVDIASPKGGAPQAGMVEDGYRFKGGDPGDPNSWERM